MTLTIVTPPAAVENLKVLLFAGSGVGKSVGAGTAPGPILWLNAEGQDALRFARHVHGNDKILEVEVDSKETLVEAYLYARDPANGIKSMVVDSVGEVYKVLLADRASKNPSVKLKGKPALSDHGDAQDDLLEIVRKLRDLPVNVILIAIQQDVDVTDADGETITEFIPFVGPSKPKCSRQIMGMVQVVGYVARQDPDEDGDDGPKWVAQVVPAKGRPCKDRTVSGLGTVAPLDIAAWVAAETKATTPKTKRAAS